MPIELETADSNDIELVGSRAEIEALGNFIVNPNVVVPEGLFGNFDIQIKDGDRVAIKREGSTKLLIEGRQEYREILAKNLYFLARDESNNGGVPHIHIEYVPDHFFLDTSSTPLTVSLTEHESGHR